MHTSIADKKDPKVELHKYLLNYRATPQLTTNEAPANLLFQHRNFRVRLPELTLCRDDSKLRATDNSNKQKIKFYSDQKKTVKQCDIAVGDTVLVKMEKRRKTDPFYDPYPLTVINKKGNMIEARRGTKVVTRNSSFFKKVKVLKK